MTDDHGTSSVRRLEVVVSRYQRTTWLRLAGPPRGDVSPPRPTNRRYSVSTTTLSRPPLFAGLPASEFDAWEWRKAELTAFARALGIPSTGPKAALATRIRRRLLANAVIPQQASRDTTTAPTRPVTPPAPMLPTVEVRTPAPSAHSMPTFFRAAPDVSRAQALAEWYAKRTTAMEKARR